MARLALGSPRRLWGVVSVGRVRAPNIGERLDYGTWGFDIAGMDNATKPGDDFFRHANGAWLDKAVIPADKPQYQLLIMLDEPQPLKETYGFITSGWNAVPTAGNVIARIAPLLGIEPRFDLPPPDRLILAASRTTQ